MQGMIFLIMNEKGPIGHGRIKQEITPEKYLCTFIGEPQVSRVIDITEIQQWTLFPNIEAMNQFIVKIQQKPAADPKPPVPKKVAKKKPVRKKAAKKKTIRKSK